MARLAYLRRTVLLLAVLPSACGGLMRSSAEREVTPASAPPAGGPYAAASASGTGGAAGQAPGGTSASGDLRERQFEIMVEAVTALRQELARSYQHSQELTQESERLRALVSSLQQQLNKRKRESKMLRGQLQAAEKRLREISTPEPESQPAPPAERSAPANPSQPVQPPVVAPPAAETNAAPPPTDAPAAPPEASAPAGVPRGDSEAPSGP